jgi:hypothetical protein
VKLTIVAMQHREGKRVLSHAGLPADADAIPHGMSQQGSAPALEAHKAVGQAIGGDMLAAAHGLPLLAQFGAKASPSKSRPISVTSTASASGRAWA